MSNIIEAPYRELTTVDPSVIEFQGSMHTNGIIPSHDREVREEWLTGAIPEVKRRYREDGQFYYVDIEYVEERLNHAYGPGRWSFIPTMVRTFDLETVDKKPKTEIFVEGRLFAVGAIDTGIVGVGTGNYFPESPRATYSNAYASAISEATKNAAKKLGIGLDIKDRDAQEIERRQETLAKVVETLATNGKRDRVFETLESVAPQSVSKVNNEWGFSHWLVDENQIDKATKAVMKVAQEK